MVSTQMMAFICHPANSDAMTRITTITPHRSDACLRRAFSMLEVEVALLLASFAAITLASLVAQQSQIGTISAGVFQSEVDLHLVVSEDPLIRQFGLAAEIRNDPPPLESIPASQGAIDILFVTADGQRLTLLVEFVDPPTAGEP